jgi:high affinity Mn2+ porin
MVGGYDTKNKTKLFAHTHPCNQALKQINHHPHGEPLELLRRSTILLLALASITAAAQSRVQARAALPPAPQPHLVATHLIALTSTPPPQQQPQPSPAPVPAESLTVFPHPGNTHWYIAGQANIIFQAHPAFHSPYQGPNSFTARGEYKTSLLGTLYTGVQAHHKIRYNTDLLLDIESSGGRGLSQALGLAGFTNLDVVRNPSLGSTPYIARALIHQTIGLTSKMVPSDRNFMSLATQVSVRRFEIYAGKLSLPDIFDINTVGSDSHLQFTNWTIDNNGAWDYAADTRGYTVGGVLEYDDRAWSARYGIFAMPTVANGIDLDWAFSRASAQNWEFELRRSFIPGRTGSTHILAYVNHAHMGSYRQSVVDYLNGATPTPDITSTEKFGAVKYGFGWNNEQDVTNSLRIFSRFGWDDGARESFAYTEVDQTISFGGDYNLSQWHRPNDKFGVAFVSNAIKKDHQNYLAYGGLGFLLGDGHLNYGRENIVESYYNRHIRSGLYGAIQLTHINNPGYNRARGPIWVPGLRMHIDF